MTKKHFEAIARVIAETKQTQETEKMAHELALLFDSFNPRFDMGRFLEAAGYGS